MLSGQVDKLPIMNDYASQINRQSPLALYYQLKRILLTKIENEDYKDGDRLPSESELTQQYQVSRHVVRQALNQLMAEGKIAAVQGAGYFVSKPRLRKALLSVGSHTKSILSYNRPTKTQVITQTTITCPESIRSKLLSGESDKAIFLERVTVLEDEPITLIRAYYPLDFLPILLNRDLNNRSVYALLEEELSIVPKRAETVISVVHADEDQSLLLNIREGSPLFQINSYTWDENNKIFEFSSGYYRVDRFELELEQTLREK